MRIIALTLFLSIGTIGIGQSNSVIGPPPEVIPSFKVPILPEDSTLLFYSDSLVWYCNRAGSPWFYSPISIFDFEEVDTCKCFQEKYLKVSETPFGETSYKLISKSLRGSLVKMSEEKFLYSELTSSGDTGRTESIIFMYDSIVSIDTIFQSLPQGESRTAIFKHFRTEMR